MSIDADLSGHLQGHDLANARDAAIAERARELLANDGPDGYAPFSERIVRLTAEQADIDVMFDVLLPFLYIGDHEGAGIILGKMFTAVAEKEANEEASIQIDRLLDEPTAAQEAAHDDRLRGDY